MDPRHARGRAGEQGMGFELYPQSEGWIFFEGPSGSAGHGVTTSGFDGVAYNTKTGELHLIDNKSLKSAGNVSSATAIDPSRNLSKNVDDLIVRVEAAENVPGCIRALGLLRQTKAALAAGKLPPQGVKLMVTSVGGQTTDVSARLKGLGVEHHPGMPPKAATPAPTAGTSSSPGKQASVAQPSSSKPPAQETSPQGVPSAEPATGPAKVEPTGPTGSGTPGGDVHVYEPTPGSSIEPKAPELPSSAIHAPHEPGALPHSSHPADIPHGAKSPTLHEGLLVGIVIAGVVYLWTGDKYAAAQSLNPAANTTDALLADQVSTFDVTAGVVKDLVSLTPPGAIAMLLYDIGKPRGEFRYDQDLYDRAIKEGRNPFCAQCHGPGGALDPNNKWNRQAERKMLDLVRWHDLNSADQEVLRQWLMSPPHK
jgi:hypothetical protein